MFLQSSTPSHSEWVHTTVQLQVQGNCYVAKEGPALVREENERDQNGDGTLTNLDD